MGQEREDCFSKMKGTSYILLTGMLMLSVAEGGGDTMKDRTQALMSELKVELVGNRESTCWGEMIKRGTKPIGNINQFGT